MMLDTIIFSLQVLGHLVFVFFIQSAVRDCFFWKSRGRLLDTLVYSILYVLYIDWIHFELKIVEAIFR